jgi:Domain of unknown function (DUF4352)/Protein of unknown function (DUF2510)
VPRSTLQAGWYPDPSGGPGKRYWDGEAWGPLAPTEELPPARKKRHGPLIFGAIVGFIIIVIALANGNKNNTSNTPSASPSVPTASSGQAAPGAPSVSPAASMAGIGQEVRDGKFAFVVTSVDRSQTAGDPSNEFEVVTAQGEFLNVHLTVSNVGDRTQTFMASNQKLQVGRDEFSANDMAAMWTQSANVDINPGNSIKAAVSFDVPPNMPDNGVLTVHDSVFSGGAKISLQPAGQ